MAIRESAVAGRFYPGQPAVLERRVRDCLALAAGAPVPAIAVLLPHAGYDYSGGVAGATLGAVLPPSGAVLLGPNHTGKGAPAAVAAADGWRTPLGIAAVDRATADRLVAACPLLESDDAAHAAEHSLEVQVPFLQVLNPAVTITPVSLSVGDPGALRTIALAVAEACRQRTPRPLVVASSDMNHFESRETTLAKDRLALDAVVAMDEERLLKVVRREGISMCGAVAAVVMIAAAKLLGASRASLVAHATSGDVTGDEDRVVGYAGIIVR